MKISRYTDSQIMQILKQAESGISAPELCREHGTVSYTHLDVYKRQAPLFSTQIK